MDMFYQITQVGAEILLRRTVVDPSGVVLTTMIVHKSQDMADIITAMDQDYKSRTIYEAISLN